jgi:hypothetical protein
MADRIMVVRHAEKPEAGPPPISGVGIAGNQDPESLIVRGWQRAGALAVLFSKTGAPTRQHLAVPATIYATKSHTHSQRPIETVSVTAALVTNGAINEDYKIGDEVHLSDNAKKAAGPVLIGWHHEAIPALANAILGDTTTAPQKWPGDRFDMIWVFVNKDGKWNFHQVPQLVLAGDSDQDIPQVAATATSATEAATAAAANPD